MPAPPTCAALYTIESSSSEKLHALIIRPDNSRSKDVFDLYHFLPKCNNDILKQAFLATFKVRGDKLPENLSEKLRTLDLDLLKRGNREIH